MAHGCSTVPVGLPHIFERFYRAERAPAVDGNGTRGAADSAGAGLGLAIAHRALEPARKGPHLRERRGLPLPPALRRDRNVLLAASTVARAQSQTYRVTLTNLSQNPSPT